MRLERRRRRWRPFRHTSDLDKTVIGDYLGEGEDFMLSVIYAYVDMMDFSSRPSTKRCESFWKASDYLGRRRRSIG